MDVAVAAICMLFPLRLGEIGGTTSSYSISRKDSMKSVRGAVRRSGTGVREHRHILRLCCERSMETFSCAGISMLVLMY